MPAITYPTTLPAPSSVTSQPVERRRLQGRPGAWHVGVGGRERMEAESVTWVLRADEAAAFRTWWTDTLVQGGAWFAATWPSTRGYVEVARRFVSPPQWQLLGRGVWRVSADLVTRGAGPMPTDGA